MSADLKFESHKLSFDLLKHLSTLTTASSLLVVTLMEKVFPNPQWIWCVALSLVAFLVALICCLLAMAMLSANVGKRIADGSFPSDDANVFAWSYALGGTAFIFGIAAIVVFAVKNFS